MSGTADADRVTATVMSSRFYDSSGAFRRQLAIDTIAEALAAERAKALAPLLALADRLDNEALDLGPLTARRESARRIRAAAGPDRTAGEETL